MIPRTSPICSVVLLSLGGFLGCAAAAAQLMSKWGHPVFTIGSTPYDSINTGQGNYPGGPGFIPGYGYYPGPGPDHYPWMDGPGTPFDRRQLEPVMPPPVASVSPLPEPLPAPCAGRRGRHRGQVAGRGRSMVRRGHDDAGEAIGGS